MMRRYSIHIDEQQKLVVRMTELRDELAAVQRETVSAAAIQRVVALFDPVCEGCKLSLASGRGLETPTHW